MKYFVMGATGFIGGHVARQLLAARHEVITLVMTGPEDNAKRFALSSGPVILKTCRREK